MLQRFVLIVNLSVAPLAILKSVAAFTDPVSLMVPADIVVSPV
jgi:hypothetical protein